MSNFGTANRTDVSRVREVTWGVTPPNPVMKLLRITGEQVSDNLSFVKSQELRSDRMTTDLVLVDSSPGGSLNFELSGGSFDDELEALLMSAGWSIPVAVVSAAGDLEMDTVTPHLFSTTGGKFAGIVVGQWLNLKGFTGGDGLYRVKTVTGTSIDFDEAPPVNVTPAGVSGTVQGSFIRNGITEYSNTLIERFQDLTNPTFKVLRGQRLSAMSLAAKVASIITGSFTYKGKNADLTETAVPGATFVNGPATRPLNGVSDISNVNQNGVAFSVDNAIMSMDINIDNQHREQKALGVLGNAGVRAGTLMATFNMTQYFENVIQATLYKNSTGFSLSLTFSDEVSYTYVFTFPKVKYTEFNVNATALDTDLSVASKAEAIRDPITDCMIQIDRFTL